MLFTLFPSDFTKLGWIFCTIPSSLVGQMRKGTRVFPCHLLYTKIYLEIQNFLLQYSTLVCCSNFVLYELSTFSAYKPQKFDFVLLNRRMSKQKSCACHALIARLSPAAAIAAESSSSSSAAAASTIPTTTTTTTTFPLILEWTVALRNVCWTKGVLCAPSDPAK
jgi:hypothetical protein